MFKDQVKFPVKWKIVRYATLALVFILLVSACGEKKRPENVLTEKQMVKVITELYLAEEKVNRTGTSHDSLKRLFPRFEAKAFEIAGFSDSVYRKSMDYYMANPEQLEYIYTAVVDSLNLSAQKAGMAADTSVEKKKDDSPK